VIWSYPVGVSPRESSSVPTTRVLSESYGHDQQYPSVALGCVSSTIVCALVCSRASAASVWDQRFACLSVS
jgi:hypothetical protein